MKHHSPHTSRRTFVKNSAAAVGALLVAPQIVRAQTLGNADKNGANSRIGLGFIGTGLIAKGHLASFPSLKEVQPIAVCDVREKAIKGALRILGQKGYKDLQTSAHAEEILANPDVDVVCIATPDHWHAALAIEAMKAGKDVYVEKPMTLTIEEGKAVIAAQKKYGRVLQVGSQQRSSIYFRIAVNLVRNGMIGDVKEVYCRLGGFPMPPEKEEIVPVPDGFDYDRWLGPTPFYEYSENRAKGSFKGGWRCYWEYGSRKHGDIGAHDYDITQWALGRDDSGPVEFIPKGFEGASHHHFKYDDGVIVWRDKLPRDQFQIHFIGTEGEVRVGRGKIETSPTELVRHRFTDADIQVYESKEHRANFIECVQSRKETICPPSVGHRSGSVCQLAAIAERVGRRIEWDPKAQQIVGDDEAASMQDRPRRKGYELPV
ncbi:MAG: Gfo/Idh/MocA family oxidoreductase [Opitutales bacterium]|jgi:predicted dehydrogenase|nr:Gfo/Idh/MocA family oxidoreductase [Opitutales bacterium]MDP4642824.1 Gfo/Idh/MocA family oxidoreductase [Opitutales bacterium]MDP4884604.1 Gfo/Idh/MocA family oxidoreductase [Opitutales bacterium]MDP5080465.1 Gfo/Idh/MocA family oxidoreductase [Opitutales bacterium]